MAEITEDAACAIGILGLAVLDVKIATAVLPNTVDTFKRCEPMFCHPSMLCHPPGSLQRFHVSGKQQGSLLHDREKGAYDR